MGQYTNKPQRPWEPAFFLFWQFESSVRSSPSMNFWFDFWIYFKVNAYLEMLKKSEKVLNFVTRAMKNGRLKKMAGEPRVAEVKIYLGFFQGDSLSSQIFLSLWCHLNIYF